MMPFSVRVKSEMHDDMMVCGFRHYDALLRHKLLKKYYQNIMEIRKFFNEFGQARPYLIKTRILAFNILLKNLLSKTFTILVYPLYRK